MLDEIQLTLILLPMKHLVAISLLSISSIVNCEGPTKDDLSAILLTAGITSSSFHCGQTAANPVTLSSSNGDFVNEASLIAALGGDNCETPSLTDNGNGTATDSTNKFLWTICVIDGDPVTPTPHSYSSSNCDAAFTGNEASYDQADAGSVCSGLTYAGRSDWQLPDAIQTHTLRTSSSPYALGIFGTATNSLADVQTIWTTSIISSPTLGITSLYEATNVFRSFTITTVAQAVVICLAKL